MVGITILLPFPFWSLPLTPVTNHGRVSPSARIKAFLTLKLPEIKHHLDKCFLQTHPVCSISRIFFARRAISGDDQLLQIKIYNIFRENIWLHSPLLSLIGAVPSKGSTDYRVLAIFVIIKISGLTKEHFVTRSDSFPEIESIHNLCSRH